MHTREEADFFYFEVAVLGKWYALNVDKETGDVFNFRYLGTT